MGNGQTERCHPPRPAHGRRPTAAPPPNTPTAPPFRTPPPPSGELCPRYRAGPTGNPGPCAGDGGVQCMGRPRPAACGHRRSLRTVLGALAALPPLKMGFFGGAGLEQVPQGCTRTADRRRRSGGCSPRVCFPDAPVVVATKPQKGDTETGKQRQHGRVREALEGKGPQKRVGRRLEEVAKAVGGGYCRLQMPLRLALGVRGTVAGHRLGALEGGGVPPPLPMHPCRRAFTSALCLGTRPACIWTPDPPV